MTIAAAAAIDSGTGSPSVTAASAITPGGVRAVIVPAVAADRRRKAAVINA